jgi:hypothetical protein
MACIGLLVSVREIGGEPVWLPHCCRVAGHEQEHRTADLPAQGLAGTQASCWPAPAHPGTAIGGCGIKPALGDRCVPGMGRQGWLVESGLGDRLPYPAVAWLASVANRQGQHGLSSLGAGADQPIRNAGTR